MNDLALLSGAALLLLACGGSPVEECPVSDSPHWQKIQLPKRVELFYHDVPYFEENRAFSDGERVWLWTGHSIIIWDLATGDWQEIPPFPGFEMYDGSFARLVNGRFIVWGRWEDFNWGALEGFVYDETLGWKEIAEAPMDLFNYFWGALHDDSRFYVFTSGNDSDPMRIGIYDPEFDEWEYVEAPFVSVDVQRFQNRTSGYEFLSRGLVASGHVLLIDNKESRVWILNLETMSWSNRHTGATEYSWLTAADDRVFLWDLPDFIAEIDLDPLRIRPIESTYDTGDRFYPLSAGRWVAIGPWNNAGVVPDPWLVYDPRTNTFTEATRDCEPESRGAGFVVMTDYGLLVWDGIDWDEDYLNGEYPREGRLLVFPDSKRFEGP